MSLANLLPCTTAFSNPSNGAWFMRFLNHIDPWSSPSTRSLVDDWSLQYSSSRWTSWQIPETDTYTNTVIMWDDSDVVCFCSGTSGRQVPALLNAVLAGNFAVGIGLLSNFYDAANSLISGIGSNTIPQGRTWWTFGHSYGSGVAQGISYFAQFYNPQRIINYNFGSPRVGNSLWARRTNANTNIRFCNSDDVVPRLLPHSEEAPIINALMPASAMQACNSLVHSVPCFLVDDNAAITQAANVTITPSITEPSLLSWLSGSDAYGAQSHRPAEYSRRLSLASMPCEQLGPNRSPALPPEQPVDIGVRLIGTLAQEAISRLPPGGMTEGLPDPEPIIPTIRYRTKKMSGGWSVVYGSKLVWLGKGKREAKKVARAMNRQLNAHMELTKVK